MYCINCGAQLLENAKFCHQCGHTVTVLDIQLKSENSLGDKENTITNTNIITSIQRVAGKPITLEILGNQLPLSDDITGLKIVRDYFTSYAEKNVAKYKDYIRNNVKNFDDIYEKAIPFSVNCIMSAMNNAVDVAKELGIFDMSYEWLSLLLEDHMDLESLFAYYTDIAKTLENTAIALASYRGIQRAIVPQWHGGGFGIIGAIKGQIHATALNIGTNAIREIGNAITDSRDKEKFRKAKEWLFQDVGMIENLIMITYNCSLMPYYALLPIFEEANIVSAVTERDNEAVKAVQEVFEAYLSDEKGQEESLKQVLNVIKRHPFNPALYAYAEWINKETANDIATVIHSLNLEFLYKYEKIALEKVLFEDIKDFNHESVSSIRCKLRVLEILEESGINKSEEIKSTRNKLRQIWVSAIQLLSEYDETEILYKLNAYEELKKEYGRESTQFKEYRNDIDRLKLKYENKIKLPILELSSLDIKNEREKIDALIKNKKFNELWIEADKQNGYAQTILYKFYLKKIGRAQGKISSVEQIGQNCVLLNKKVQEGSLFAKWIYDVMTIKIRLHNNPGSDTDNARRIHRDYLYVICEAAKANIVYAKYELFYEMAYEDYWKNYSSFQKNDDRLDEFSNDDVRGLIKEAANSLIPIAVDRLCELFRGKGPTHFGHIERNDEKADKLQEFAKQLSNILEPLSIMESCYEVSSVESSIDIGDKNIKTCNQCGNIIKDGKKFCSQCGTKVM